MVETGKATSAGTRAGRPADEGDRFPCGKLKPRASPVQVRRILDHALATSGDRRFGSEVGRLLLTGKITSDEAASAFAIADIYGTFERFEGLTRSARSPAYETGFGRGETAESPGYLKAHADAKARFRFLQQSLSAFPPRARTVVEALCVENLSIASGDPALLESLRALLRVIASDLERFADGARLTTRERRRKESSRTERLVADEYAFRAEESASESESERARRRRLREQRIAEILARDAARATPAGESD
jgi:hypothetical protein